MDLHSSPCFQAAPGMLYLPAASTSAYPARDNANETELSMPQTTNDGERCCLPADRPLVTAGVRKKEFLLLLDRLKDAPGESTVGRECAGLGQKRSQPGACLGCMAVGKKRKKREIKISRPRFADSVMTQGAKFSYRSAQQWGERLLASP